MGYFEEQIAAVERPLPLSRQGGATFWRKDAPTFEDGRMVMGGMWSHQLQWWELENFVKLLVGGYGAGKTNAICKRMISSALQNAPCPVALVSPTFPIARQTTILTLCEMLEGKRKLLGGRSLWWNLNKSTHEFTIKHRGRTGTILIYSGDNPLSLRGPNLGAAGIDEPFIQDQAVFDQMIARVRHPEAKLKEIVLTGTPEELNWGYELAEGELSEKHDVGVVHASTKENLALDPMFYQRLIDAYDEATARAYAEGQFVNLARGQVYHSFDAQENVVNLDDQWKKHGLELGAGMDFNVDPMSAIVFWRKGDHLHFFDEIELPNSDTEYMCDLLKERYWEHGLRNIYPDASGVARTTASPGAKSDFYWIKQAGFRVCAPRRNPSRKDRYNAVNGKFKARSGRLTLTISPKCKKLRRYLQQYTHEGMNTKQQKGYSHLLDAFGYPIAFLFPVSKDQFKKKQVIGA
jgi:hypothetical protein